MTRWDGLPHDLDSPVYSKTIGRGVRTNLILAIELAFTVLTLVLGGIEYLHYEQTVTGYCLMLMSLVFFGMFVQFFYGFRYNCTDLLMCHTVEAGFLAAMVFVFTTFSFLFIVPEKATKPSFRISMNLVWASAVCFIVLLAAFAVASHSRSKEIVAYEKARQEHFKKLLIKTLDTVYKLPHPEVEEEDDW